LALSIEDHLAIQQLYNRYNHQLDYSRAEEWAACFTEDGTFEAPGVIPRVEGRTALVAFCSEVMPGFKARHINTNHVFEGDAGAATGTCYMFSWQVPGGLVPMTLLNTGVYVDTLAKAGGEWRFKTRTLNLETLAPGIA
jgi:hypothetical protein